MGGQPQPNDPFPSGVSPCWPAGAEEEPICKSGKASSKERRLPCWDLGESGCFEAMVMITESVGEKIKVKLCKGLDDMRLVAEGYKTKGALNIK